MEKVLYENNFKIKTAEAVFIFLLFLCKFEVLVALDAAGADLDAATTCCLWKCDPLEVWVLARIT